MRKNIELVSLCKALGLDFKNKYENGIEGQGLRYGNVMIMCDQDNDGSHIKGLVINFFQYFWPNLLKIDGFLQQFVTPLVKVKIKSSSSSLEKESKTDKKIMKNNIRNDDTMIKTFFSMPEYEEWRKTLKLGKNNNLDSNINMNKFLIKYYKGLGTNTAEEGKTYFKDLNKHKKLFNYGPGDFDAIDLGSLYYL